MMTPARGTEFAALLPLAATENSSTSTGHVPIISRRSCSSSAPPPLARRTSHFPACRQLWNQAPEAGVRGAPVAVVVRMVPVRERCILDLSLGWGGAAVDAGGPGGSMQNSMRSVSEMSATRSTEGACPWRMAVRLPVSTPALAVATIQSAISARPAPP